MEGREGGEGKGEERKTACVGLCSGGGTKNDSKKKKKEEIDIPNRNIAIKKKEEAPGEEKGDPRLEESGRQERRKNHRLDKPNSGKKCEVENSPSEALQSGRWTTTRKKERSEGEFKFYNPGSGKNFNNRGPSHERNESTKRKWPRGKKGSGNIKSGDKRR